MIKIENHYYSFENEPRPKQQPQQPETKPTNKQSLEVIGDVKGYLKTVSLEIRKIKELRLKQKEESSKNQMVLQKLNPKSEEKVSEAENVTLHLSVPEELYELDLKIAGIEQKVKTNELVRQKIQRKGKIAERAKMLTFQIQKLAEKSPDVVENSIQKYCQGLDEREENIKAMFLYEAFIATQGMTEEMQTISSYLANLNEIQTKLKGMASKASIVENHSKLLEKRLSVSQKISELHAFMKEEYGKLQKQIDAV